MGATNAVAIIGAGVAGASAARVLADQGLTVRVYDKGRAPGGRCATRTRDGAHFDHGAQYFTARDPEFIAAVDRMRERGVIAPWQPRLAVIDADGRRDAGTNEARWVAQPGMSALATDLLQGLDVQCSRRVVDCTRDANGWWLGMADGVRDGPFASLLCTLPATQAVELLPHEAVSREAAAIRFAPCWAAMLEFDRPLGLDFDAAFVNDGPLSWIARDSSKPGRPAGERWLVHAGGAFSRAHLESTPDAVGPQILAAFTAAAGSTHPPARWWAHRWRYALAEVPVHAGALADATRRIALGGDWCCGSRVEGAWLSGRALAAHALAWAGAPRSATC